MVSQTLLSYSFYGVTAISHLILNEMEVFGIRINFMDFGIIDALHPLRTIDLQSYSDVREMVVRGCPAISVVQLYRQTFVTSSSKRLS